MRGQYAYVGAAAMDGRYLDCQKACSWRSNAAGEKSRGSRGDLLMRALSCQAELDEAGTDLKISLNIQVDSIDTMHIYCLKKLKVCDHGRKSLCFQTLTHNSYIEVSRLH